MWFLPSRGRADMCQEVLDACVGAKMTEPGVVYVDGRVDDYPNLKLPDNWSKLVGTKDLVPAREWWFKTHPNQKYYAQLCDDLFPHTEHFDQRLIENAGDWGMVECSDKSPTTGHQYLGYTPPLVWGGELIRAAGFWTQYTVGIRQAEVDVAWIHLLEPLGLRGCDESIIVEHRNWRGNARVKDETDNWVRDGVPYIQKDIEAFNKWKKTEIPQNITKRIREARLEAGKKQWDDLNQSTQK